MTYVRPLASCYSASRAVSKAALEINNPAAAAVRAVDDLEASSQKLLASLSQLAVQQISAEQLIELDKLRREVTLPSAAPDALALADLEDDLASWLTRQVWTNLIDNAVEAMDGKGTLRLSTRAEQDDVVIEIGDTGRGMPPHVAARAFEPFFTTKETGNGIGLGLDIARRVVVERHGGTIVIDSRPGETVLRVRIPVRPPDSSRQVSSGQGS